MIPCSCPSFVECVSWLLRSSTVLEVLLTMVRSVKAAKLSRGRRLPCEDAPHVVHREASVLHRADERARREQTSDQSKRIASCALAQLGGASTCHSPSLSRAVLRVRSPKSPPLKTSAARHLNAAGREVPPQPRCAAAAADADL